MKIAVNMLEHSPRVNVRSGLDKATLARYVEAFQSGDLFGDDPVVAFREPGTERYVIADGNHRVEAAKQAGVTEIETRVLDGDETAALKFALRCNAKHGLLRRDGDVQACIRSLMLDPTLSEQYRTHQERAELLGMSYKTFQRHFAKWRQSKGGSREERAVKAEMQERAEKKDHSVSHGKQTEQTPFADTWPQNPKAHIEDPDTGLNSDMQPDEPPPRKPREKKPELTPEQKRIAKELQEAAKRERLDAANRKTFEEGLQAICSMPFGWDVIAKRWTDIDADRIRFLRDACDEFLKAREQAKAA